MPEYRRAFIPGGSFFFTVVTFNRRPIFDDERACAILGNVFRDCKTRWPWTTDAIVLLPDHLHAIWTLPDDSEYSMRWAWIKKEFTKVWLNSGGEDAEVSKSKSREGRHGIWQPRFWEHTLRDEADYERHFDYIHYNPVKHGLVTRPIDWHRSSFHRYVKEGVYPEDWGCAKALKFDDIAATASE